MIPADGAVGQKTTAFQTNGMAVDALLDGSFEVLPASGTS